MKILVTGATGFLGRALCAQLQAQGHEVVGLSSKNCDLTIAGPLDRYNNQTYDQIYHLAAWTQAGDFCLFHPGEQWVINQRINTNVLAWWRDHQPQAKFICIGTSCSYDPQLELVEENYLAGTPIESLFTYAMTKRMLYAGLLALQRQYNLSYLHLVPSTLFGPGYHTDGRQMHFIFDLIRKILRGKIYGEPVVLWGDGYQRRELVFIDDCVRSMIDLSVKCRNDTVNIGVGVEFTIRHFAELISDKVGYDSNAIRYDATRYVGAKSKCLVVRKLQKLVPDLMMTPLEVGISRTVDWFWDNRDKLLADPR
jgi:GDP-L-fucose synthase